MSNSIDEESWKMAFINEIRKFADQINGKSVSSIFFGGGTPSLMNAMIPAAIIEEVARMAYIDNQTEITLETNPTSYEAKKFIEFKAAGINRISIGIQSLNDPDLKFLGREHSSIEAIQTIRSASKIFDNYSFDLIYTRPNQTPKMWATELNKALELARDHISLYQLTIEKGTHFYSMHKSGQLKMPNDEISYQLYCLSSELMEANGYKKYEISNFARNQKESRHNLCYWEYDEYLGIGPGAHSRFDNTATYQIYNPNKWLKAALGEYKANQSSEKLTEEQVFTEILLMGLRLSSGISLTKLAKKIPNYKNYLNREKLKLLAQNNLITLKTDSFYATKQGELKLNKIIEFLC